MPTGATRRDFLRSLGVSAIGAVSGCASASQQPRRLSVTPAPIPTGPASSDHGDPNPRRELGSRDFVLKVREMSGFTPTTPARLGIAVTNTSIRDITAKVESIYGLPFLDDDYAATDRMGETRLFLAPDDPMLTIEPKGQEPVRLDSVLPDEPIGDCWKLPFDWQPTGLNEGNETRLIQLPPGKTRSHQYSLYYVGDCGAGKFTFENILAVAVGPPTTRAEWQRVRLGFVVTVTENRDLTVGALTPEIGPPISGNVSASPTV